MIEVFQTEPKWNRYTETDFFQMFHYENDYIPNGSLVNTLTFGYAHQTGIELPLRSAITKTNYQHFYHMFDIQRAKNFTQDVMFYDIWILTEGLPTHDLEKMNQMQLGETCCYDPELINGYARIVKKTKNNTIFEYREGHFTKGVQDNFGRFLKIDGLKIRSYTGWWPSGSMGG